MTPAVAISDEVKNVLENTEARAEFLRAVPLFADLNSTEGALKSLAILMKKKTFHSGEPIIKEGATESELYLLVDGQASVYKSTPEGDDYKVAILSGEKKACFGEGGLLGGEARSATIRADGVCHCMVLEKASFDSFCEKSPQWALPVVLRIAHSMMLRLKTSNNDLMLLYKALVAEIRGQ